MTDLTKLTDDHIKHIAQLASDNDFDFVELEITRDENHIKIAEAKRRGLQEIVFLLGGNERFALRIEGCSYLLNRF